MRLADFAGRLHSSAVAWSFVSSALRAGASIFLLPLMLHKLPTEELGMWYVFASLGGLVSLLDLGIALTASRSAGYLWAGAVTLQPFGVERGDAAPPASRAPNFSGLADLIATLRVYYLGIATSALLLMLTAGSAWVWYKSAPYATAGTMRGAWLLFCVGAFANITGDLWPAVLTGLNEVRRSEQILVMSLGVYYLLAVSGLLMGFGLWALVVANLGMYLLIRLLGRSRVLARLKEAGRPLEGKFRMDLLQTLWPNAWRLAAVSLGTYLIISANTLICSSFLGLEMTASYGLTFQVLSLLLTVSRTWTQVKIPTINQWRTMHRESDIAWLFASRMRLSILTYLCGAMAACTAGPWLLSLIHSKTALLATAPLILFAIISFLEMHHGGYAILVLTENRNPFLKPALFSGLAVAMLSLFLTPRFGIWGLLAAQGLVQASFNNWWVVLRAIKGLSLQPKQYFRQYFFALKRPEFVHDS